MAGAEGAEAPEAPGAPGAPGAPAWPEAPAGPGAPGEAPLGTTTVVSLVAGAGDGPGVTTVVEVGGGFSSEQPARPADNRASASDATIDRFVIFNFMDAMTPLKEFSVAR